MTFGNLACDFSTDPSDFTFELAQPASKATAHRMMIATVARGYESPARFLNFYGRRDEDGSVVKVTPESAGWEYVGFEVIKLADGEAFERRTGGEEVCLVPVSGACSVSSGSERFSP